MNLIKCNTLNASMNDIICGFRAKANKKMKIRRVWTEIDHFKDRTCKSIISAPKETFFYALALKWFYKLIVWKVKRTPSGVFQRCCSVECFLLILHRINPVKIHVFRGEILPAAVFYVELRWNCCTACGMWCTELLPNRSCVCFILLGAPYGRSFPLLWVTAHWKLCSSWNLAFNYPDPVKEKRKKEL